MAGYCAIFWDPEDVEAETTFSAVRARIGRDLLLETDEPGIVLFDLDAGNTSTRIVVGPRDQDGNQCAFVGRIYRNAPAGKRSTELCAINLEDHARIVSSAGKALIADFWGDYIAIVKRGKSAAVITSPTSYIPCFFLEHGGVTFVFSHLEHCSFISRHWLTLNYNQIRRLMIYDKIQNGETGFNEIKELIGGERLAINGRKLTRETLWDPRRIARQAWKGTELDLTSELRTIVLNTVNSRADSYDSILIELSGGLDSTIVAACLAHGGYQGRVICGHRTLLSKDLSEVQFARLSAHMLGFELVEFPLDPLEALDIRAPHPASVRSC